MRRHRHVSYAAYIGLEYPKNGVGVPWRGGLEYPREGGWSTLESGVGVPKRGGLEYHGEYVVHGLGVP